MIKKLFYFIIPLLLFSFSQDVKALDSYKNINSYVLENSYGYSYYNSNSRYNLLKNYNNSIGVFFDTEKNNIIMTKYNKDYIIPLKTDEYNTKDIVVQVNDYYVRVYLFNGKAFDNVKSDGTTYNFKALSDYAYVYIQDSNFYTNYYNAGKTDRLFSSNQKNEFASNFDIIYKNGGIAIPKTFDTTFVDLPKLSYTLEPIYKDGYLSSYGIKVNSTIVDDTLFKYQYAIKDNLNDSLKWIDLYNNNFLDNQFTYITKKSTYFYFRILDKSNNEIIDTFNVTVNFDLLSPQYDIIFNQEKFYLNGTNYIDRVGLSITYKSSVDGLKYQYQYVDDGSSLSDNNWVDTESDIYHVYNVNGVMYARILDNNNNNVLYSSNFKNTLIGTQDTLVNPSNFPLYNNVQKVLNFNNGSISDLVLVPVKVLMFMSDSLNNNVCNEYSFGSLLGHELKLPCIDIKSLVGETIYNFYDLVCSFFISLGIIKLLKNIYMRFMTLDIRDIDRNGGIF